jgi:hypothetical protein
MPANLFDELKEALGKFKAFLDDKAVFDTVKTAVRALKSIVPQITELIDKLVDLMGKLRTEIEKLDPNVLGGTLTRVTEFTTSVKTLLVTAKGLLPNEADTIDDVIKVADVVSSLPSLGAVKKEITDLIDVIVPKLKELKA